MPSWCWNCGCAACGTVPEMDAGEGRDRRRRWGHGVTPVGALPMLADQLTIVVVTYNSMEALPSFLQRVKDATAGDPCKILVSDNGSDDGVEDFVGRQSGEISFLGSRENAGYGAALNRG